MSDTPREEELGDIIGFELRMNDSLRQRISDLERALAGAQAELAARSSITQALSEGRIASVTIDRVTPSTSLGKVRIVVELDVIDSQSR